MVVPDASPACRYRIRRSGASGKTRIAAQRFARKNGVMNSADLATSEPRAAAGPPLRGISSMATRSLLAALCEAYAQRSGQAVQQSVQIEAVGGVLAAQRVAAGENFDLVLLASDAIDKLMLAGHLAPGSRVDIVRSPVAVAVRIGALRPDIGSAAALRQAVLAAPSIALSTGPSGVFLLQLFERWGIAEALRPRLRQAPPGVPVGSLVAAGEVALGFQQLSELIDLPGIEVLGLLPADADFITTFAAAWPPQATRIAAVRAFLAFASSDETLTLKRRHGMEPA